MASPSTSSRSPPRRPMIPTIYPSPDAVASPPLATNITIRGWRAEFRQWWELAAHTSVVFSKSPHHYGSLSICLNCCRLLFTRYCDGHTTISAIGCDYHLKNMDVPFAMKSTIVSTRLRDVLRPTMNVVTYRLHPGETVEPGDGEEDDGTGETSPNHDNGNGVWQEGMADLIRLSWVRQTRTDNPIARKSNIKYVHSNNCFHGDGHQDYIVQGNSVCGIYFLRCDGRYVNALGERLEYGDTDAESASSTTRQTLHKSHPADELSRATALSPHATAQDGRTASNTDHSIVSSATTRAFAFPDPTEPQAQPQSQSATSSQPITLDYDLGIPPEKVAEQAWRIHHPGACPDEESPWGTKRPKRRGRRGGRVAGVCAVM